VSHNSGHGISLTDGDCYLDEAVVSSNGKNGIIVNSSSLLLSECDFTSNGVCSIWIDDVNVERSVMRCRGCVGDDDFNNTMSQYEWDDEDTPMYEYIRTDDDDDHYEFHFIHGVKSVCHGSGHGEYQSNKCLPSNDSKGALMQS